MLEQEANRRRGGRGGRGGAKIGGAVVDGYEEDFETDTMEDGDRGGMEDYPMEGGGGRRKPPATTGVLKVK